MAKTAILIDGGYYKKRAKTLWVDLDGEGRAREVVAYCKAHLKEKDGEDCRQSYRTFYYDCEPSAAVVYHPHLKKNIHLGHSDTYTWMHSFLAQLRKTRKMALRLGHLSEDFLKYNITADATKKLCAGKIRIEELTEKDFKLNMIQKGVDMRIGVDIASMVFKKQVDQIILIAGDSDFVPAAKLARREGIDFILDPLHQHIKDDLFEHIDGLRTPWPDKYKKKE